MPTERGFVQRIEVGRQGLVVATLLHDDATTATYQIQDLDADPERFNERLSKLAILRDAMNRDEPVEIEYTQDGQSQSRLIDRAVRITRSQLDPSESTQSASGSVIGVTVATHNRTGPNAEASDLATVALLADDGTASSYRLDLQVPERAVAIAQLEMIRAAQADGEMVSLSLDASSSRILAVQTGGGAGLDGGGQQQTTDGFVESIAHSVAGGGPYAAMAIIAVTTAPPFSGTGDYVPLLPFTPAPMQLLVVAGSTEYELFRTALQHKLRVRVQSLTVGQYGQGAGDGGQQPRSRVLTFGHADQTVQPPNLVRGVQVLHCLASASRPVWIRVARRSLDVGPEERCTDGVPTSDLSVSTLRDLQLSYRAEWCGWGCFNHGVYRFQLGVASSFEIKVDGEALCVYASDDGKTRFAHACLDGDHEVCVVLAAWTCRQSFDMDVYRIR